jgi:hypothetical protein
MVTSAKSQRFGGGQQRLERQMRQAESRGFGRLVEGWNTPEPGALRRRSRDMADYLLDSLPRPPTSHVVGRGEPQNR